MYWEGACIGRGRVLGGGGACIGRGCVLGGGGALGGGVYWEGVGLVLGGGVYWEGAGRVVFRRVDGRGMYLLHSTCSVYTTCSVGYVGKCVWVVLLLKKSYLKHVQACPAPFPSIGSTPLSFIGKGLLCPSSERDKGALFIGKGQRSTGHQ